VHQWYSLLCLDYLVDKFSITQHLDSLILLQDKFKTPKFFKRWHSGIMIFPLNPRASYAIVYTISPCISCLCIHVFRSISPYFRMFMYPRYWRYFTMMYVYVSTFSLYFTIFSYVYVSKVLTLFHHTDMLCIHAFALFHHTFVCLCIQGTGTISPYLFCMFMYPCFHSISPYILVIYVYVSKLPALFHHTCYVFMFPCFCTISPYILIIYVMYPYYSHYFTT
jgi:hypothetical protein